MAGGGRLRKRVEVDKDSSSLSPSSAAANNKTTTTSSTLLRAKNGSAFTRCEECKKDVAVALISMHNCSTDAKIKMNLEAQVVEKAAEAKKKPAEKRKAKAAEPKAAKKGKKAKNPNAPKRPPTAFFVFMEEFRKSFKEANPDCKSVSTVAKEGGEKWKSLTEEEKKPYVDRAAELKAEYEKALESNDDGAENEDGEEDSAEKEVKEEIIVDDE